MKATGVNTCKIHKLIGLASLVISSSFFNSNASAAVIYTDLSASPLRIIDITYTNATDYNINFAAGFSDITFRINYSSSIPDIFNSGSYSYGSLNILGNSSAMPVISGQAIDANLAFTSNQTAAWKSRQTGTRCVSYGWFSETCTPYEILDSGGVYLDQTDLYMGVALTNTGTSETNYGWILLDVTSRNTTLYGSIKGYAFEDRANTAILAGSTVSAVPLPGAFGLMMLGATSLLAFRRRSKKQ